MHFPLLQPQKDTGKGACGPPDPHCPLSRYSPAARFLYEPVHELVEQQAQLCGGESGAIGAGLQEAQVVAPTVLRLAIALMLSPRKRRAAGVR